jgi:hypothetical protein
MVRLVVGNYCEPFEEYNFPMTPEVEKACQELLNGFALVKDNGVGVPADEEGQDDVRSGESTVDEDEDDEEFITHLTGEQSGQWEDDGESLDLQREGLPTSEGPARPSSLGLDGGKPKYHHCPIIQPRLRNLLVALYTQLPGRQASGRFFSPIMRYIVLSAVDINGGWVVPGEITQHMSVALFCGRLTLYSLMHQEMVEGQHHNYHKSVSYCGLPSMTDRFLHVASGRRWRCIFKKDMKPSFQHCIS